MLKTKVVPVSVPISVIWMLAARQARAAAVKQVRAPGSALSACVLPSRPTGIGRQAVPDGEPGGDILAQPAGTVQVLVPAQVMAGLGLQSVDTSAGSTSGTPAQLVPGDCPREVAPRRRRV